ncbi:MAG: hypothetical protein JO149_06570 [Gammaproteobacteria bacterium]|nr:hypothetical protein [Gammaproteobacteria bacterium]
MQRLNLSELFYEIKLAIFSYLTPKQQLTIDQLSKGFNLFNLQNVWPNHLLRDFSTKAKPGLAKSLYFNLAKEKKLLHDMIVYGQLLKDTLNYRHLRPDILIICGEVLDDKTINSNPEDCLVALQNKVKEDKFSTDTSLITIENYNKYSVLFNKVFKDVFLTHISMTENDLFFNGLFAIANDDDLSHFVKLIALPNELINTQKVIADQETLKILSHPFSKCIIEYLQLKKENNNNNNNEPEQCLSMRPRSIEEIHELKLRCFILRDIFFLIFKKNLTNLLDLLLEKHPLLINADLTTAFCQSLLLLSIAAGNYEMFELLVQKGADIHKVRGIALEDFIGEFTFNLDALCVSPIFQAICSFYDNRESTYIANIEKIINYLLQNNVDLEQKCRVDELHCLADEKTIDETPLSRAWHVISMMSRFHKDDVNYDQIIAISKSVIEKANTARNSFKCV